ncbi:MAG: NAD(+) synthase [Syntrophaceae bacterium]|nr:NAD(+) synthase [Syntrophaceae bacterium]
MHKTSAIILELNAKRAAETIERYLQNLLAAEGKNCVVMGLSGGIDSAVLATLTVRAVGAEHVKVYHLKDRDSEKESELKARKLANWLGLTLITQDISHVMNSKGIYSPLIMRINILSCILNRMIQHAYYCLFRETPHKSTLKAGCGKFESNPFKRFIFNLTIRHIENAFNERHRYRRQLIEQIAEECQCIALGAANRSEAMVGWFVKDGIDDLPFQPMLGMYKTQVWQLAEYLELPEDLRHQVPSPDMMKGLTDEFAIGISYHQLDKILDCIDRGLSTNEILSRNITQKELKHVQDIYRLSEWKRESPHAAPPVDGSIKGQFRLNNKKT